MLLRRMSPVAAVLAVIGLAGGAHAQFVAGNLTVLRVGDGSSALSSASTTVFLDQYSPTTANQAAPNYTVTLPTSGAAQLTVGGSTTSEGQITRSVDGSRIIVAGYDVTTGRANVSATSTGSVLRVVNAVDAAGAVTRIGSTGSFSSMSIRSAASADGATAYANGANTGTVLIQSGSSTTVSNTVTNQRVSGIFNGNLYFSTFAGTAGVYQVGTGLPTGSGTAANLIVPTGSGSSPFAFAVNAPGTVVYVADDRADGVNGGIQKWTGGGTSWTLAGVFSNLSGTNGARGLAVDFSGANPVLYATTTDNRLVTVTDFGSNFADAATVLATAGTNTAFRGVTFSPVPEPTTAVLVGTAALGFGAVVRRKRTANSQPEQVPA